MPIKRFIIAPDAAARRVQCEYYEFNGGAPKCKVRMQPWCLAIDSSPEACAVCKPPEAADPGKETT